jgi:hypothetical protein
MLTHRIKDDKLYIEKELKMKKQLFRNLVGNQFFTVTFIKKDGTLRKLNGKLGVTKHLKGGKKSYDDSKFNYITVYDLANKGYRTVNLNTIKTINAQGLKVTV